MISSVIFKHDFDYVKFFSESANQNKWILRESRQIPGLITVDHLDIANNAVNHFRLGLTEEGWVKAPLIGRQEAVEAYQARMQHQFMPCFKNNKNNVIEKSATQLFTLLKTLGFDKENFSPAPPGQASQEPKFYHYSEEAMLTDKEKAEEAADVLTSKLESLCNKMSQHNAAMALSASIQEINKISDPDIRLFALQSKAKEMYSAIRDGASRGLLLFSDNNLANELEAILGSTVTQETTAETKSRYTQGM